MVKRYKNLQEINDIHIIITLLAFIKWVCICNVSGKDNCLLLIFVLSSTLTSCKGAPEKLTIGMIPVKDAAENGSNSKPIRMYLEEKTWPCN